MQADCDCDCDVLQQIESTTKKTQAELDSMKRSALGSKMFGPLFSTQKTWTFGTRPFMDNNEWKPKFLSYCKESSRLATFATWLKQMNPKPEQLAKAGFFYEGVSDTCRCFHCGLIVHNWEPEDDALGEHYRHSPRCHFVEFLM